MVKATPQAGNVVAYIRSIYPLLTKAEKKVADIVLNEVKQVIYDSLTDLAEKAGVGETSVLRFCRHIGYKGFQEFKLALALELDADSDEAADAEAVGITESVKRKNIRIIEETTMMLREDDIRTAVDMMLKAVRIVFFGVGSSGFSAEIAKYRFIRMGLPVEAVTDSHFGPVKATLMNKDEVAVLLSVSGSTVDIVDIAKIAKDNGVKVVCITSHVKSPVTKYADVVLLCSSRAKPSEGSAFASTIPQLHILDILFEHALQKLGESALDAIQKTARASSRNLY
jgi:DNA-binding MurR/RpiR family transcriptional regulator